MNSKNILILTLRIGAIIILVNQLERIPANYNSYYINGAYDWFASIGHFIFPTLLSLLFSAFFWFYPEYFIKNLSMDKESNRKDEVLSFDLAGMLIAIVGLYIIVRSLTDLIYHITFLKIGSDYFGSSFEISIQDKSSLIASCVEIILGLILMFGGKFISALITRFQKEMSKDF